MIDVCFSDSVKGSLRCAQRCGNGKEIGVSVSKAEQKRRIKQEKARAKESAGNAIPLGGRLGDVLGLSFMLSIGDILQPFSDGCIRQELLYRWLTANPWGELEEARENAQQYWQGCLRDLQVLEQRARAGEPVRIWADNTPDSACGILFAADILSKTDAAVTMVSLPPWTTQKDGTVIRYVGWGEVEPEELGAYLSREEPLSQNILRMLSEQWQTLKRQNAPMRAVVNGQVMSVQMDFYDHFIRHEFADGQIKVANLIGNVLGCQLPGISDWLIAERIHAMLDSGELRMVRSDSECFYGSVVQKDNIIRKI